MAAVLLLAVAALLPVAAGEPPKLLAPSYAAASIVHAATSQAGPLAPNLLVSIYGKDLSYSTRALTETEIRNGQLPDTLTGSGVRVFISTVAASIYFVSPAQVNLLVPANLAKGKHKLQLMRDGVAGPEVEVFLEDAAPGFFQADPTTVIAIHLDGALVTTDLPARPGELITLFAGGLGQTRPNVVYGRVPNFAAQIERLAEIRLLLNGEPVEQSRIEYAGITPGFAGLYQINLRLPEESPLNPEIRIKIGEAVSPSELRLPCRPLLLRDRHARELH